MFKGIRYKISLLNKAMQSTWYPMYSYFILANGAVYVSWQMYLISNRMLKKNFMLSRDNIRNGRLHTLITHAFTHINIYHLLSSTVGIYFIGGQIEWIFGPNLFLKVFFMGAILGGLI